MVIEGTNPEANGSDADNPPPHLNLPATPSAWAKILVTAQQRRSTWKRMYVIFTTLHYGLSLLAMAATALVGILPSSISFESHAAFYAVLSSTATVFVFLVAFSSPSKQSKAYIGAWRHLDQAIVSGNLTQDETAIKRVLAAIEKGEEILSGKDPF